MEGMEPIAEILAKLKEKHPRLVQNLKHLSGNRTCRGNYDWISSEELELHMAEIVRIEDKQELCRDCDGNCQQGTNGFYLAVMPSNKGELYSAFLECEKHKTAKEQNRLNSLIQSSGIPPAYRGKTFDDYIVSDGVRDAVKMAKWLCEYQVCSTGLQGQARHFWRR